VGLLPRSLEIAGIDPHQTGFVGKGSDHLQLIKFWRSRAPGKGSAAGQKFLAPHYYSQRAVFASPLSAFSLICLLTGLRRNYSVDLHKIRWKGGTWATENKGFAGNPDHVRPTSEGGGSILSSAVWKFEMNLN